jgi:hypothetical protein
MGMREEDNDKEMGSMGRRMAMAAQDEEHKKMAQEMSSTSLGLQVSCLLFFILFFLLLTNVLGTSYLQG